MSLNDSLLDLVSKDIVEPAEAYQRAISKEEFLKRMCFPELPFAQGARRGRRKNCWPPPRARETVSPRAMRASASGSGTGPRPIACRNLWSTDRLSTQRRNSHETIASSGIRMGNAYFET